MKTAKNDASPDMVMNVQPSGYLLGAGAPVSAAWFQFTVRSLVDGTPHSAFFDDPKDTGLHKNKAAKMWLHPMGLLVEQRGRYKVVPSANLLDVNLKP